MRHIREQHTIKYIENKNDHKFVKTCGFSCIILLSKRLTQKLKRRKFCENKIKIA